MTRCRKNKKYAIRDAAAVQYCSLLDKLRERQVSADPRNWRRTQCIRARTNVRSVDAFSGGLDHMPRTRADQIGSVITSIKGPGSLRILRDPISDHTGFPKEQAERLASGWKAHYGEALEKLLA
jgi:hypothetical protein